MLIDQLRARCQSQNGLFTLSACYYLVPSAQNLANSLNLCGGGGRPGNILNLNSIASTVQAWLLLNVRSVF